MRLEVVVLAVHLRRPGHVEVAQADGAEVVRGAEPAHGALEGELRLTVRVDRLRSVGLGDGHPARLAVYRRGRAVDQARDAGGPHRLQQRDAAGDVDAVVEAGIGHRLADERARRAVEDGIDAVEGGCQARRVGDVADDQPRAPRHRGTVAARKVVEDGDLVAGLHEALDAGRADVPGTAHDQELQSAAPI